MYGWSGASEFFVILFVSSVLGASRGPWGRSIRTAFLKEAPQMVRDAQLAPPVSKHVTSSDPLQRGNLKPKALPPQVETRTPVALGVDYAEDEGSGTMRKARSLLQGL